jgi:hypothetical protein
VEPGNGDRRWHWQRLWRLWNGHWYWYWQWLFDDDRHGDDHGDHGDDREDVGRDRGDDDDHDRGRD